MKDCDRFIEEAKALFESYQPLDSNDVDGLNLARLQNCNGSFKAINGDYYLNRSYNGLVFQRHFDMTIIVDRTGRLVIPIVFLRKEKQLYGYLHFLKDNTCCLGLTHEVIIAWGEKQEAKVFFEDIVDIFLIDYLTFKETKKFAYGEERPHDEMGTVDYYKGLLEMESHGCTVALRYIYDKVNRREYAKGHNLCPCGNGKAIRHCHGVQINSFINSLNINTELKAAFLQDLRGQMERRIS